MVDHTLAGNCTRCEACELRREGMDLRAFDRHEETKSWSPGSDRPGKGD